MALFNMPLAGEPVMAVEEVPQITGALSSLEPAPQVFYYSPWRYLQIMWAIVWSAFAHPFSTTVIDLTTGEMRHETEDEL
jgi:hypothetical protein